MISTTFRLCSVLALMRVGSVTSQGMLNDLCQLSSPTTGCSAQYSKCMDDGTNSGITRCLCIVNYAAYSSTNTDVMDTCGLVITSATSPGCGICETQKRKCIQPTGNATLSPVCYCPSGANCENINVNVTCAKEMMNICYRPSDVFTSTIFNVNSTLVGGVNSTLAAVNSTVSGVNSTVSGANSTVLGVNSTLASVTSFASRMYVDNLLGVASCVAVMAVNDTDCGQGSMKLAINLTDYETCGATKSYEVPNIIYRNMIVIESTTVINQTSLVSSISFNSICSFTAFQDRAFYGIGVVRITGTDHVTQVNPQLVFNVLTLLNNPIPWGVSIRVGDKVIFRMELTRDGTYSTFAVLRCTASSSSIMPDPTADTKLIINNGCPVDMSGSSDYWFMTQVDSNTSYILQSGPVPAFKMSSSNNLFVHCAIQTCLVGDSSCINYKRADCVSGRKKRAVFPDDDSFQSRGLLRERRAAGTNYDISAGLVVSDASAASSSAASSSGGFSALFVVMIVIAVLVAIVLIVAMVSMVMIVQRNRTQHRGGLIDRHPQVFALPRIERTHNRL